MLRVHDYSGTGLLINIDVIPGPLPLVVIPAEAGIQRIQTQKTQKSTVYLETKRKYFPFYQHQTQFEHSETYK